MKSDGLPRQAQDKHNARQEKSKKGGVFGSVGLSQHHLAQLIVSSAGAQQSVDSFIGRCHVSPVV
jgi:hypothetical protein